MGMTFIPVLDFCGKRMMKDEQLCILDAAPAWRSRASLLTLPAAPAGAGIDD